MDNNMAVANTELPSPEPMLREETNNIEDEGDSSSNHMQDVVLNILNKTEGLVEPDRAQPLI
eukprot:Ihof_evm2s1222 gene=Ihof_evmTU2s1222